MKDNDIYWIGVGDIHGDYSNLRRIPELSGAEGLILSGDLTNRGTREQGLRLVEAARAANPKVYAQIGNMDGPVMHEVLESEGLNIHARGLDLGHGVGLIGVGMSSPTPFGTPSEYPDVQLGKWLAAAYEQVKDAEKLLLVAHDPPHGTKADMVGGRHVGSESVREFVERVQPDVCLTGHIHEARSVDHLGRTVVINPGMLMRGSYVVIGLKEGVLTAELRTI